MNFRGHSLTTRMLAAAMPKHWYTLDRHQIFTRLLQCLASESEYMATTGVQDADGLTWWCITVGISGDWPWLAKSATFNRSFSRVQKRVSVRKPPEGICHLCTAGRGLEPHRVPFEDIQTRRPQWLSTMFSLSPFAGVNLFSTTPQVEGRFEALWKFDVFHTCHLGIAKHVISSTLALLSEREVGSNVDDRFTQLDQRFTLWCKNHSRNKYCRKLTKELIGWETTGKVPAGTWHKGEFSDTLLHFIEGEFGNQVQAFQDEPLLVLALECVASLNSAMREMYAAELFLEPPQAARVAGFGLRYLRRYGKLADLAHRGGRPLFPLMPKAHAWHHLMLELELSASTPGRQWCLNPLCYSTQMCEDFVGRPSRLARRTRPGRVQSRRVIQRYLKASYHEWVSAKLVHVAS